MLVDSCIPIIPSHDLNKSLNLWRDKLGFEVSQEMFDEERLIFCMLRNGVLAFMLNQRDGDVYDPEKFEGIRLYWRPTNIESLWESLKSGGYDVSDINQRDYGQKEFFLTDGDGVSHCFGVPTEA